MRLACRGVTFSYEEGREAVPAVRDVGLELAAGGSLALLGASGAGKSTLLQLVRGLDEPEAGAVVLDGVEPGGERYAALRREVGLVFQIPELQLFAPSAREDVAFGPRNLGLTEDEVRLRVGEALLAVGAEDLGARAIHHLSFGQQKRVAIAGVLAMRPPILILDEPTAGLDPAGEHSMLHLLGTLNKKQGITIVLATHSVDTLPLFADRIYLLNQGRVLKEGSPEEVFSDHDLIERASLRLPYVSRLLNELKRLDGVPIQGLPLTLREAREQLLSLIPEELIMEVKAP